MKKLLAMTAVLAVSLVAYADEVKSLFKPINKAESWRLELHNGAEGTIKAGDDSITFDATKLGGDNWHVQVFQVDLDLKEGQQYTVKMKLSASKPRNISLVGTVDTDDYHEIGLREDIRVDKEVRSHDFTFRASGVASKKNRIGFMLGDEKGDVIVKEMTLTEKEAKK